MQEGAARGVVGRENGGGVKQVRLANVYAARLSGLKDKWYVILN